MVRDACKRQTTAVVRKVISTYFQTQRRLRYVSSINVIASITFMLCRGKQLGGIAWYTVTLSLCRSKERSLKQTTDRFKTNFDCKTAFTTTRVYIKKVFKFKARNEQIPLMKCVLYIKLLKGTGTRNELSG